MIFKRLIQDVWQYPKEYGSLNEAWTAVRAGFGEILDLAAHGQIEETDDVRVLTGAQAARAKLLYLYFPDELVPVTSKEAIDYLPWTTHSGVSARTRVLTAHRPKFFL